MRKSISTFLTHLPIFTSKPSFFAFPFALSSLLLLPLSSSSPAFPSTLSLLRSLFLSSGFPPSSDLFPFLTFKLTHTLLSFLFLLPLTLSSLLLSKSFVIRTLFPTTTSSSSSLSLLFPLVVTYLCNVLVILSANIACFSLLVILLNLSGDHAFLVAASAAGAVAYSIVAANAYVVCGMALIVSGAEGIMGFRAVIKAWDVVVVRGKATATALALAVSVNAALAGVEAIFHYRVVVVRVMSWHVAAEAVVIGYMYAVVLVVEAIFGCVLYKAVTGSSERGDGGRSIFGGKEKLLKMVV
ncbi:Unknown protein [Striga hermonthica]|uniref:Transmembrane protein n=1 Tax=Striga hermonthica TaxID=68872 RepID=A0A9N7RGA8_STRHE|nr:Unknown protein [Striga hermonthica]